MLRGQETLIHMVGKRRRLDATSKPLTSGVEPQGKKETIESEVTTSKSNSSNLIASEKENLCTRWVKCPVCGKEVLRDDGSINMHLDICLMEKTQSKSNGCSVSQFSKVDRHFTYNPCNQKPSNSFKEKQGTFRQATIAGTLAAFGPSCRSAHSKIVYEKHGFRGSDASKAFENGAHDREFGEIWKKEPVTLLKCMCLCHFDTYPPSVVNGEGKERQDLLKSDSEKNYVNLERFMFETVIVGRKFNQLVKIEKDMKIRTLREPENHRDPNAIKIVQLESAGGAVIGYLPREVALHLSCLIDRTFLRFEGVIKKVPENLCAPIPIKLMCEKTESRELEERECFASLWQMVIQAAERMHSHDSAPHERYKYLANFLYIINSVLERDLHLFSDEEVIFIGAFFKLTEDAQRLYVRLCQRKGPWFRVSQISYADISDVPVASDQLLEAGFAVSGDNIVKDCTFNDTIRERLHVLNVPELRQLLSTFLIKSKKVDSGRLKREELLDRIVAAANENQLDSSKNCRNNMISLILTTIGPCIRISDKASFLIWRLQRLFFMNGEQEVSAFLLVDVGAVKFPKYSCHQTRKIFATREALLDYEQAIEIAQKMDMALESNDKHAVLVCLDEARMQLSKRDPTATCDELGDTFLARFTAAWVYAVVVSLGVTVLERERRYTEAVDTLRQLLNQDCCPGKRGYWTVRLSMDLEHLGLKDESLEIAEAGLHDPRIRNGDRVALQRRVLRLGKPPRRWKKPSYADALAWSCKEVVIRGRPLNCKTGFKSRFYGYDGQQCRVEELALQYYAAEHGGEWQGVHSENGVWMTLFALLMWDVLFADVPNVFWHPFQTAPLDLNTDAFYAAREVLIESQLERISGGEASDILAATWSQWFGTSCRGVNWERHSLEDLQVICTCVGGFGLASICRLLAEDYAGWAGGMPDLLLWRMPDKNLPSTCMECSCYRDNQAVSKGEAKLVEVKGPRDRLSEQQRAWIHVLMQSGICVEVCKVLEDPKVEVPI